MAADLIDGSIGEGSPLHATYAAGREKDRLFTRAAVKHGLVRREVLIARLPTLPASDVQRDLIAGAIARDFAAR